MSLHQEMLGSLVRLGALALCTTITWGSRIERLWEIYQLCSGSERRTPSTVSENSQWNVAAKTLGYRFFIRKDLTMCLRWTHTLVQIVCLCQSMWSSWCVIFLFFHYVEYQEPGYEWHHHLLFRIESGRKDRRWICFLVQDMFASVRERVQKVSPTDRRRLWRSHFPLLL